MAYFRAGTARATHEAQQITVAKTPLASFESNVSGLYIPEILAYIQASQSGTGDPSPSNPRPINGVSSVDTTVCGKNLFNGTNVINAYFSSNGTITASGATRLVYARCKANTTYTVSKTAGTRFGVAYSSELPEAGLQCSGYTTNNTASSITITTGADAKYICAYVYHSSYDSGSAEDMLSSVQIEESNTATAFEAYTGTTATTSLGGTYYGGYLNVTTGLLTVTRVSETIHFADKLAVTNLGECSRAAFNLQYAPKNSNTDQCDIAPYLYHYSTDTPHFYCIVTGGNNRLYFFYDNDVTITDIQVVYELATPQTYQLTPAQLEQLLGQNNVFCSGNVAVKYWKID